MVVAERPRAKEEKDNRPLKVMDCKVFFETDDGLSSGNETQDIINLGEESYIILFSGRRGGGKTSAMSYFCAQEMALNNRRVLSNYPIEFMLSREVGGETKYFPRIAEKLDLYKLLCFDKDYHNSLIVMDEAPDIISHMSAQTWKNRLLNIFVRQLRKNNNSLILGAQSMSFIDKSFRWQVDIEAACKDGKKVERDPTWTKGSMIYVDWYDHSGVWTGQSTEERKAYAYVYRTGENNGIADISRLKTHKLWGDKDHKPVFDTN
ncbi:MAG TPA: zonular occludens toxin domain-containing protein, partial [Patescibacteria group bacterium]|nr:zonular occludens toxin domain-containing protein [Patescibacteria group bacterium]